MVSRSSRILVVNPNCNEAVTRGLRDALARLAFDGGPLIECRTLVEGPYGIETQEHVESVVLPLRRLVAASGDVDAFVIACYSDPGLQACREATTRPVFGINGAVCSLRWPAASASASSPLPSRRSAGTSAICGRWVFATGSPVSVR